MKNRLKFDDLAIAILILSVAACGSIPKKKSESRSEKLNHIVDDYFEENLKLNPLFATSIGDHRFDAELTIPLTEESRKKMKELLEKSLSAIHGMGCKELNHQDTLTCETFREDLEANLQLEKVDLEYLMPFNQFDSFFSDFAELASGSSYVTFETAKDYENFLARMRVVPAYFEAIKNNMREGLKKGITTPKALVLKALKQTDALLNPEFKKSLFFKPALKIHEVVTDAEEASVLLTDYENVVKDGIYPAYKSLNKFVKEEYLPHARLSSGLSGLSGGPANYRALIKINTTTNLTANQIMILGLAEVKRIRAELETVKKELHFKGSLQAFFKSLRTDPKLFPFHSEKDVIDAYQSIYARIEQKIPEHFRLLPKSKFEIREVEKFKADSASEAYQNGTPDGARPGIFWVPIPDAKKYAKKNMESLFLHEAIPGHHFQISIQQELSLPRYRRFSGNNAYVEGWGLYAESLGKTLGIYTDPYQWVGRLENEMHRAIRLVVDPGLHWKGWSREKAIAYSLENEPIDKASAVAEIERYMAIPGQALAYKVGEQKILELKQRARTRLGSKYDDRDFHDEILKDGALPLSVLENKVDAWLGTPRK